MFTKGRILNIDFWVMPVNLNFIESEDRMIKKWIAIVLLMLVSCIWMDSAHARLKKVVKPDKSYDFKAVKNIVILPITSKNVEFGKVSPKRLPKIKKSLRITKRELRRQMVEGMRLSKPNKRFHYKAPNRRKTTLLVKYNIETYDNGNVLKRNFLSLFGGGAKVKLRTTFIDAKTKKTVAEVVSTAKDSGGGLGSTDSDVLFSATKMADASIFRFMKKLTKLKYDTYANMDKKMKLGLGSYKKVMKNEKEEKKILKSKTTRRR